MTNIWSLWYVLVTTASAPPMSVHLPSDVILRDCKAKTVGHSPSRWKACIILEIIPGEQAVNCGECRKGKTMEGWSSFSGASASQKWNIWMFLRSCERELENACEVKLFKF